MSNVRTTRMVWHGQVGQDFADWREEDQDAVKAFVIAHGIDINWVPTDDTDWVIRLVDDQFELELWVFDQVEDNKRVMCPHCPTCIKRRKVTVPLVTPPPRMHKPWFTDDPQLIVRLVSIGDPS